eukprot:CAMPEP_0185285724 /NCGR_PEP_ID=MMETSP1363-20130426/1890_1 /TAXON_ID=38817 /ORGANISM="Gephyrocapsa oceanica, Strain RCC1303" /LENGTH=131 /DNA_ID=CAMNT_0027881515 /DNA_START=296 /DNA_END=691 /DNA_ORIENTATION=-
MIRRRWQGDAAPPLVAILSRLLQGRVAGPHLEHIAAHPSAVGKTHPAWRQEAGELHVVGGSGALVPSARLELLHCLTAEDLARLLGDLLLERHARDAGHLSLDVDVTKLVSAAHDDEAWAWRRQRGAERRC